MESLFLVNLTSPPLLFFFLGAAAAWLRSDLEIPGQVAKFLSLYLLFAIGFKGGVALSGDALDGRAWGGILAALALACVVPLLAFVILKRRLGTADAAALAATYGSISAVTFVTATSYLDQNGISWGGHLVAAMALMESPAIIIGILLYRIYGERPEGDASPGIDWRELGREATLCLQVFTSPEDSPEDEAILTLAVRLPQYPPDTMQRIRQVREQYYEELPVGASHWVLITTDFR